VSYIVRLHHVISIVETRRDDVVVMTYDVFTTLHRNDARHPDNNDKIAS
jgi:hypothetical protein